MEAAEILAELVAQPSVNPRLAPASDATTGESRVTDWLCDFFEDCRWPWLVQEVEPGRSNALALVLGGGADVYLWEAHQDTVAAAGMTDPFRAAIRQGRLYGRGACDVKGGLAAMLTAAAAVSTLPPEGRPTIVMASTINEECGFTGVRQLVRLWDESVAPDSLAISGPLSLKVLRANRPQFAIVAEPTDLQVVAAHRGVVRWQATMIGKAAHSSRPEKGANAVCAMARVVMAIERHHRELAAASSAAGDVSREAGPVAQCGPATVCVTTFHGGAGPNTVPDRAVIDIDRRLAPGEDPIAAYGSVVEAAQRGVDLGECRLEHDRPWMQSFGLADAASQAWAGRLAEAVRARGVASQVVGVPYGTNAATLAAAGIPAAVFGPGSIEQAHTIDEYIELAELARAVDVLTAMGSGAINI